MGILLVCALLWSLAALMGRAATQEDVRTGKITDWIILGPLWASFVYLALGDILRDRPKGRMIALIVAVATWVVVALASNRLEDKKQEMRNRRYEKRQTERGVEQNHWSAPWSAMNARGEVEAWWALGVGALIVGG